MNRRTLTGTAIGGAGLGAAWAAGLSLAASRGDPTLEVIGVDDAQVLLLGTRRFRTLILIGYPSRELQAGIASLLGVFRRRIDLLTGSRAGIDALGKTFAGRHNVARTIGLEDAFAPLDSESMRRSTPSELKATLPEGLEIRMRTISAQAWDKQSQERHTWLIEIRRGTAVCCAGPDLDGIAMHGPAGSALTLAPAGSLPFSSRKLGKSAIAINADSVQEKDLGPLTAGDASLLVRIHPRDTAVFTLTNTGIQLPTWAEQRAIIQG